MYSSSVWFVWFRLEQTQGTRNERVADRASDYIMSATQPVSMLVISVRMKAISLRAFSIITLGSSDVQRKQLGANTMAKLDESIFVLATMSGCENSCRNRTR